MQEGISYEYKDDDIPLDDLDEDDEDDISLGTEDSRHEAEKITAINVENAYMEEKEQALLALKAICKHTGETFFPYIYQVSYLCVRFKL